MKVRTKSDRRERIRPARDQVRVVEAALGNRANVAARVGVHRTRALTGDQAGVISLAGHLDPEP